MKLKKLRINHDKKGFTLIELMIVIAIIGILAAIAIPNFIAYRDKAFCTSAEYDATNILAAIVNFHSIPSHNTINNTTWISSNAGEIAIASDSGLGDKATISPLSGSNTATLFGPMASISVSVQDSSGRCPLKYRQSQAQTGGSGNGWIVSPAGLSYYTRAIE